jgi:hypothetical protein
MHKFMSELLPIPQTGVDEDEVKLAGVNEKTRSH